MENSRSIEFGPVPSIVDNVQKPMGRTRGCVVKSAQECRSRVEKRGKRKRDDRGEKGEGGREREKFAFNREQILCHFSFTE